MSFPDAGQDESTTSTDWLHVCARWDKANNVSQFFVDGVSVGTTDELGSRAVDDRFHVRNLHATILEQLGLDPNRLSYFFAGLDQKLVGVEGAEPIWQII